MANVALNIIMGLVDKARPGLQQTQATLVEMKKVHKDFNEQWGETAEKAKQAGAVLVGVGTGIVASLSMAAKAAADFNAGLLEVSTLVDTTAVNMDEFKQGINDLAMTTGQAAGDLTRALYQAISAGVDAGEAIEFMGVAARAAVAGVTDTETAVNGLTNIINAFGLETSEAQAIADSMFATVKGGKITFAELSDAMARVAPAAAGLGISFQEVNAAFATITAGGTDAREAATYMRGAIISLIRPSADMNEIFKAVGYETAEAAIRAKGLKFALDTVMVASGGSSARLQELLGSIEGVQGAQILAGTGAQKFADELAAQERAAGEATTAYEKMAAGGVAAANRLKEALGVMARSVGDAVLPALASLANALQPIVRGFAWLAATPIGQVFVIAAGAIGALLIPLGTLLMALPFVVNAINFLRGAFAAEALAALGAKLATLEAGVAARIAGLQATYAAGGFGALAKSMLGMAAPAAAVIGVVAGLSASLGEINQMVKDGVPLWKALAVQFFENTVPLNGIYKALRQIADWAGIDVSNAPRNLWGFVGDDDAIRNGAGAMPKGGAKDRAAEVAEEAKRQEERGKQRRERDQVLRDMGIDPAALKQPAGGAEDAERAQYEKQVQGMARVANGRELTEAELKGVMAKWDAQRKAAAAEELKRAMMGDTAYLQSKEAEATEAANAKHVNEAQIRGQRQTAADALRQRRDQEDYVIKQQRAYTDMQTGGKVSPATRMRRDAEDQARQQARMRDDSAREQDERNEDLFRQVANPQFQAPAVYQQNLAAFQHQSGNSQQTINVNVSVDARGVTSPRAVGTQTAAELRNMLAKYRLVPA